VPIARHAEAGRPRPRRLPRDPEGYLRQREARLIQSGLPTSKKWKNEKKALDKSVGGDSH
jgi:hypothetical protein